jgi:hypothetical protein
MTGKTQTGRVQLRVEAKLMREIQGVLSQGNIRLFRNNVGSAFLGAYVWDQGAVVIPNPQRVTYGLCEGSSDLIGWRSRTITEDMVGKKFAQFVAVEVKSPSGRLNKTQDAFIRKVREAGGIAGVARTLSEATQLLIDDSNEMP